MRTVYNTLCNRYEDRPEIDGPAGPLWDRSIAPFRAVATTAGVASETLRFSSEDGEFECLYPSPSQLISHLVRADAYHGITVEDARRIGNAVAEAARAIRNNPVTRLV